MKKLFVAAAALLIAVPVVAIAKDGHDHHGKRGGQFERLDADKDGNITTEEAAVRGAKMLERADKNGDGVITPDEAPRLFERIDADGDGKITAEELAAISTARVMRADTNGDGVVSKEEAKAARDKMKEARKDARERKGEKHRGKKGGKPADAEPAPAPTETP